MRLAPQHRTLRRLRRGALQETLFMMLSFVRRSALVVVALSVGACTNPTPPTAPTLTSFQPILEPILNPKPSVGGLYQGTMLYVGVTGGTGPLQSAGGKECTAQAYETAFLNGNTTNDASMVITQDTTNISKVTIRLASEETGLACTFDGAIGASNGLLSDAPPGNCSGASLFLRCAPDPVTGIVPIRQLQLVSSSLSASFDGWPANVTGASGRTAQTFNIFDGDGKPVGGLVFNFNFFVNRR
jgi:hypothetical protein